MMKVLLAATATWIASMVTLNAIVDWARFPWERHPDGSFIAACLLPPLVIVGGHLLFKWALGEKYPIFVSWFLKNGKFLVVALALVALTRQSYLTSVSADDARYDANQAYEAAYATSSTVEDVKRICSRY